MDSKDKTKKDYNSGKYIFMPAHPDADSSGYVDITAPGFVTDLVKMILLAKVDYQNQNIRKLFEIPINKV